MNAIEQRLAASDPAGRDTPMLSDQAAAQMLAAIMREGRVPRRSRRRRMAIGGAALALAGVGTAIAGGGPPDFVSDALRRTNQEGLSVDLDRARRIATVKNGSEVLELYRTPAADGGSCWSLVRRAPSGDYRDVSGTECVRGTRSQDAGGMTMTGDGEEGVGWTLYGELPAAATAVELRVPGEPPRRLGIDNGHFIVRTGPAAYRRGYRLLVRDSSGAVIAHEGEGPNPKMCPTKSDPPGVEPC